jgi:hypothetical protein
MCANGARKFEGEFDSSSVYLGNWNGSNQRVAFVAFNSGLISTIVAIQAPAKN